jgi:hypothetical protein
MVACGEKKQEAAAAAAGGASAATQPAVQAPTPHPGIYVDRFQFGEGIDANGVIVKETSVLPPGSTAALSLLLRNAPAGTQMRAVWQDLKKNTTLGEEVKTVGDQGLTNFQRAKPLLEGSYRVRIAYKRPDSDKWEDCGGHDFKVGKS